MRRLAKHLSIVSLTLAVGAILTVCSLVSLVHSSEVVNTNNAAQKSCNSSCISHGQPAAIGNIRDEKDEDDKEPTPPLMYWQQLPTSLLALYVAPITYFFFVHKRKKILLTMQLRF